MKINSYKRKSSGSGGHLWSPSSPGSSARLELRRYQQEVFKDRTTGIQIWLWARQTGKSYALAAWAVDRLLTRPGRLVTVLSNSKSNGAELNLRVAEVCKKMGQAFEQENLSGDKRFESMNCETRIYVSGQVGRIKVLAANPRTARGFSGDLILDEFAFHEDSTAIWDAVEPILASNKDFLCRIASTPNGKGNLFYRLCTDGVVPVIKVTRTDAHRAGCAIFHPITREKIDPESARKLALNQSSYDQNYECVFTDESMTLLTHELISAAERPGVGFVCEGEWTDEAIAFLRRESGTIPGKKTFREWISEASDPEAVYRRIRFNVARGSEYLYERLVESNYQFSLDEEFDEDRCREERDYGRLLFAGVDVGRNQDRTVITVIERAGPLYLVRAILRISGARLPEQQEKLETILNLPTIRLVKMDSSGIGLGLFEYTARKFPDRVEGVNFSTTVPLSSLSSFGTVRPSSCGTVRKTEVLATQLLQAYEDRAIQQPMDKILREELHKPQRVISPSGRVSIAVTRTETGHADHFWSLALALDAAKTTLPPKFEWHAFLPRARMRVTTL